MQNCRFPPSIATGLADSLDARAHRPPAPRPSAAAAATSPLAWARIGSTRLSGSRTNNCRRIESLISHCRVSSVSCERRQAEVHEPVGALALALDRVGQPALFPQPAHQQLAAGRFDQAFDLAGQAVAIAGEAVRVENEQPFVNACVICQDLSSRVGLSASAFSGQPRSRTRSSRPTARRLTSLTALHFSVELVHRRPPRPRPPTISPRRPLGRSRRR